MLEQVLTHLNNWFIAPGGIYSGEFRIENGSITLPFLRDGQYFRIIGSIFNDGLHRYNFDMDLQEEIFTGCVWALAIPRAVIDLTKEIGDWQEKNGAIAASPFSSESFGGYSYTKPGGVDESSKGWQSAFSARLSQYRKLREYGAIQKGTKL